MLLNVFRMLASTAAGVWLGGIALMAIVAQTTFSIMRTTGIEEPDAIAGRVMVANFYKFDRVQIFCGGILLAYSAASLIAKNRRGRDWLRTALILAACGILIYSVAVVTPEIIQLQPMMSDDVGEAPVRVSFDHYHHLAERLAKINLFLVLAITLELAWTQPKEPA